MVRQGNYEYKYTDNTGIQKKMVQNQTLTQLLTPVWNDANIPLNKIEIVKEVLTNAGFENTDKFFINSSEENKLMTISNNMFGMYPDMKTNNFNQ